MRQYRITIRVLFIQINVFTIIKIYQMIMSTMTDFSTMVEQDVFLTFYIRQDLDLAPFFEEGARLSATFDNCYIYFWSFLYEAKFYGGRICLFS